MPGSGGRAGPHRRRDARRCGAALRQRSRTRSSFGVSAGAGAPRASTVCAGRRPVIRGSTRLYPPARTGSQLRPHGQRALEYARRAMPAPPGPDVFVSYAGVDVEWATWIAWELEQAGFTTALQARDFLPGANFVAEMQAATADARCTLAVLTADYLSSRYTEAEWTGAFRQGTLLPARVAGAWPGGVLGTLAGIDLAGVEGEAGKRERLVDGVRRFLG